jgi:hypothetical protein
MIVLNFRNFAEFHSILLLYFQYDQKYAGLSCRIFYRCFPLKNHLTLNLWVSIQHDTYKIDICIIHYSVIAVQ